MPRNRRKRYKYKLDEISEKVLSDLQPATAAVYRYYIARAVRRYKKFPDQLTEEEIQEFSKGYPSPSIVRRIIKSFIKRYKYDYKFKKQEVKNEDR